MLNYSDPSWDVSSGCYLMPWEEDLVSSVNITLHPKALVKHFVWVDNGQDDKQNND